MIPFFLPYPVHLGRFLAVALAMTMTLPAHGADQKDVRHSDLWLQATLVTTYALNEHLNPLRIDVDVEQGVATLSGSVDSDVERDLAGELAAGVDGIKQVNNELQVQPDEAKTSGETPGFREYVRDANITMRVKSRLLWDAETQGLQINVDTRDGVVHLKGRVASKAEADLAAQIARNTSGVHEVRAKLDVDPDDQNLQQVAKESAQTLEGEATDAWITTKVKSSLLYTKGVDGTAVHVETRDGVVRLSGKLPSQDAIDKAIRETRRIAGVKEVTSELRKTSEES
jgi:osmotically-inducible protein OsmY